MSQIKTAEVGLHVLRDLTDKKSATGALQKTIIDRLLTLVSKDASPRDGGNKRRREEDADASPSIAPGDDHYPRVIAVRNKSGRTKKPTDKAKEYAFSL